MRFNEVVLFVQIVHRGPGGVRWRSIHPAAVSTCNDDNRSGVGQQTLLEDDIAVVELLTFAPSMKTSVIYVNYNYNEITITM